tara:strand:+ start:92 stop:376 length:285 start_codon:yes stop_codon:yes gene_type:complete
MGVDTRMTIHERLDEIQKTMKEFGEFQQEFSDAFKNFCAISSMMTKNMMSVILTNMTQDDRERYENMLDQINEMYEDEELNSEWEEFPNNDSEE